MTQTTTERPQWLQFSQVSFKACDRIVLTSNATFMLRLKTFQTTLVYTLTAKKKRYTKNLGKIYQISNDHNSLNNENKNMLVVV